MSKRSFLFLIVAIVFSGGRAEAADKEESEWDWYEKGWEKVVDGRWRGSAKDLRLEVNFEMVAGGLFTKDEVKVTARIYLSGRLDIVMTGVAYTGEEGDDYLLGFLSTKVQRIHGYLKNIDDEEDGFAFRLALNRKSQDRVLMNISKEQEIVLRRIKSTNKYGK